MRAYERLLDYVAIHTTSDKASETVPSTARQFDLANRLKEEMLSLGIEDAEVDSNCYVTGHIPASKGCESAPLSVSYRILILRPTAPEKMFIQSSMKTTMEGM